MAFLVFALQPRLTWATFEIQRDDFRAAARTFASKYLPEDRVVFFRSDADADIRLPFRYYFRQPLKDAEGLGAINDLGNQVANVDRFWLIMGFVAEWGGRELGRQCRKNTRFDFGEAFPRDFRRGKSIPFCTPQTLTLIPYLLPPQDMLRHLLMTAVAPLAAIVSL